MKTRIALLALAVLAAACASGGAGADVKLENDEQKTLYALGIMLSRNVESFELNEEEARLVAKGLADGATKKTDPAVELETWAPKVMALSRTRMSAKADVEKKRSEEFLAKTAKEEGAEKTASGILYFPLGGARGQGTSPKPTDTVKVHYRGTLIDGKEFDSSYKRGQPAEFPLQGVIPCWTEGLQKMKPGEKARLVCPSNLAYGDRGSPPTIPGGAALIFEIELLEVTAGQPHPGGQRHP